MHQSLAKTRWQRFGGARSTLVWANQEASTSASGRACVKPRAGKRFWSNFGYKKIATSRVSIAEAKNKLPELIKAVENGERVTICRHGKPVVDIVRTARKPASEIEFGALSHLKVELDSDWWKPMSKEEAEMFWKGAASARPGRHLRLHLDHQPPGAVVERSVAHSEETGYHA
jgi:prevent-host-death family protein